MFRVYYLVWKPLVRIQFGKQLSPFFRNLLISYSVSKGYFWSTSIKMYECVEVKLHPLVTSASSHGGSFYKRLGWRWRNNSALFLEFQTLSFSEQPQYSNGIWPKSVSSVISMNTLSGRKQVYKNSSVGHLKGKDEKVNDLQHSPLWALVFRGGMTPVFLNFGTRWRWLVSVVSQPLNLDTHGMG